MLAFLAGRPSLAGSEVFLLVGLLALVTLDVLAFLSFLGVVVVTSATPTGTEAVVETKELSVVCETVVVDAIGCRGALFCLGSAFCSVWSVGLVFVFLRYRRCRRL